MLRAIVADDDSLVRFLHAKVAERAGYVVAPVGSKAEAVAHYRMHPDSIIVTDNDMEYRNAGLDLVKLVRAHDVETPITMVSGGDREQLSRVLHALPGDNVYIAKSASFGDLQDRLSHIVRTYDSSVSPKPAPFPGPSLESPVRLVA